MKRILSLIFVVLTMSVMIFAEEMPKEVNYPSDKLSLSTNDEMLYDGILYTGKIIYYDSSYMNLKDGHLEGKTYVDNEGRGITFSFNIVNGELDGYYSYKEDFGGIDVDILSNFKEGKLISYVGFIDTLAYNLTFDHNGNANGTLENNETGFVLNYKDGVAKTKSGLISTFNTGDKGDELIFRAFYENGELIVEDGRGRHINRKSIEEYHFPLLVGKVSDK